MSEKISLDSSGILLSFSLYFKSFFTVTTLFFHLILKLTMKVCNLLV